MKFQPVSHSWVALNPKPQGVIQFVGGAFFGTFWPMFFYRSLLQRLFNDGYTIVILPFNFTFDHYAEAGFLVREQYEIMPELVRRAIFAGYEYKPYLSDQSFSWLGHSIGCKYISLLEALSALPLVGEPNNPNYADNVEKLKKFIDSVVKLANPKDSPKKINGKIESIFTDILILINDLEIKRKEAEQLIKYYIKREANIPDLPEDVEIIESIFIKNQPSLLLAPVNTGLESAVPKPLAGIIISLGFNVKPTPDETFALIKEGDLFNLMGLTSFKKDKLASTTCEWFEDKFKKPPEDFRENLKGGHLRPLGIQLGNFIINFPIPTIGSVKKRNTEFESPVSQLFQSLEDKQNNTNTQKECDR